ncbi:MAG: hypothetical protein AAF194_02730, partial [Pseudomonadota bacterium]
GRTNFEHPEIGARPSDSHDACISDILTATDAERPEIRADPSDSHDSGVRLLPFYACPLRDL